MLDGQVAQPCPSKGRRKVGSHSHI